MLKHLIREEKKRKSESSKKWALGRRLECMFWMFLLGWFMVVCGGGSGVFGYDLHVPFLSA